MSDRSYIIGLEALIVIFLAGCASIPERNPLPEELQDVAQIPGIPNARAWADSPPELIEEWFDHTKEELQALYPETFDEPHNYLAISGGGSRGAFGAGLLSGWSESGTRPEFTMVTGVSTGAIIAPFAFLGSKYDHVIKKFYTEFSTKDVVKKRGIFKALTSDALSDTTPLRENLERFIDDDLVAEIAAEFANGRTLMIGTTNLDAARPVSWNITRIAASDAPHRRQLIIDVILASAAIPVAFPPVVFTVEADGQIYDELHVDGGASSTVYFYPLGLDWAEVMERLEVEGEPNLYVIRNGFLNDPYAAVDRNTIEIAGYSMSTLMTYVVLGDMHRIYLGALRDGLNYRLAMIPEDFKMESNEAFDPEYMTELFNLGYELAKSGYDWSDTPPGFDPVVVD